MDDKKAESIFLKAVEDVLPSEWPEFLDRECGGNPGLRNSVASLLRAHCEDVNLVGQARRACGIARSDIAPSLLEHIGDVIGPYKLVEQIGEGGMGVVFVAEQLQPIRRKVALKVIKPGMDSKSVLARFDAERQSLALMDHPNVAKVLDAGTTNVGRPYFMMELIQAQPVTKYSDETERSIQERLDLFIDICMAVQHAHQKGIIHRVLKPNNVLVTEVDGKPIPKVIDFGVAKALGNSLTDLSIYTNFQTLVGTPLYMSPEQATLGGVDVDTRSDVYSLGVLLYELLTGRMTIDHETLKTAGVDEIRRIIREEEPARPSAAVNAIGAQDLSEVAAHRQADPRKLCQNLKGELDWLVMKALEKDRGRRYESASAFAADVARYMAGDVVEACPPSYMYRIRKSIRKHKSKITIGGLVLLGTVVAAYLSYLRLQDGARSLHILRLRSVTDASSRVGGWSDKAWEHARQASSIRTDDGLRDDTVVTLIGLDARLAKSIKMECDYVVYDESGTRLAMAATDGSSVRVWSSTTDSMDVFPSDGKGPVEFDSNGDLRQFIWRSGHEIELKRLRDGEGLCVYAIPPHAASADGVSSASSPIAVGTTAVAAVNNTANGTATVTIWNKSNGYVVGHIEMRATAIAFTADSSRLAVGTSDGTVTVFGVERFRELCGCNGVSRHGRSRDL